MSSCPLNQKKGGISKVLWLSSICCIMQETLNEFMALGKPTWKDVRETLTRLLSIDVADLRDDPHIFGESFVLQVICSSNCRSKTVLMATSGDRRALPHICFQRSVLYVG
jgi:hypothetical protein